MELYKRYVAMQVHVDREGKITPLALIWEDGQQYPIDRILLVRKAVSPLGGCGTLYRCRIANQIRHLYYEQGRWFIESHHP